MKYGIFLALFGLAKSQDLAAIENETMDLNAEIEDKAIHALLEEDDD
jgi:hypothetical protein